MTHALSGSLLGRTLVGYVAVFLVPVVLPLAFVKLVGLGGLRSMFSFEASDGPVHRLDPRIKVVYPFVMSSVSVLLGWQAVLGLLAVTLLPWLVLRPSAARVRAVLTMAIAPALAIVWSQALFHPALSPSWHVTVDIAFPSAISWMGTPGISLSGLAYGGEQSGRLLVSTSASLMIVLTTTPADLVWAFRKFHLPAKAGFALGVALRFLPELLTRMTVLLRAVEVRGLDLSRPRWRRPWELPGYARRVLTCIPAVTVPLLIGALRSTSTMAMVADSRAFGAVPTPTTLHEHRRTPADVGAAAALVLVVVAAVVLVATGTAARGPQG